MILQGVNGQTLGGGSPCASRVGARPLRGTSCFRLKVRAVATLALAAHLPQLQVPGSANVTDDELITSD